MRLGYLYSRYPVISQTFCDAEMLALERRGIELVIGSVYPPLTSLRHEYIARLHALIHYAPPQEILRILEHNAKTTSKWPRDLIEEHDRKYGPGAKAELRARNALYFADFFTRTNVDHVHVHFANRAAHTALFLKKISGIPFSVTAHGQDFMKDLGSDDLLREICAAAEFVAAETDYSRDLLRQRCPASAAKIHRVYNGIDLERFSMPRCDAARPGSRPTTSHKSSALDDWWHSKASRISSTPAPNCDAAESDFHLRDNWRRPAPRDAAGKDRTIGSFIPSNVCSVHYLKAPFWKNFKPRTFSRWLRRPTPREPPMFFRRSFSKRWHRRGRWFRLVSLGFPNWSWMATQAFWFLLGTPVR